MSHEHPVVVDVDSPLRFERVQVLVRVLLAIVLGWFGITVGWLTCMLFFVLPLLAAIAISVVGAERYTAEVAPRTWAVLRWLLQLWAYLTMLTDRFPTADDGRVRIDIRFTGTPTVGGALSRLLTSIPSGLVLMLVWFVSGILWFIGVVVVLFGAPMPDAILAFQRGVLRWQARLVAYHASLVVEYPPFSFDTDAHHHPAVSAAQ
jgi:uncharacterized protein DUF4389